MSDKPPPLVRKEWLIAMAIVLVVLMAIVLATCRTTGVGVVRTSRTTYEILEWPSSSVLERMVAL